MESIITSKTRLEIDTLISEVIKWHSDRLSPDYNECEVSPCNWCERAKKVLEEMRPKLPSEAKDTLLLVDGRPQVKFGRWVQMDGGGVTFQETDDL